MCELSKIQWSEVSCAFNFPSYIYIFEVGDKIFKQIMSAERPSTARLFDFSSDWFIRIVWFLVSQPTVVWDLRSRVRTCVRTSHFFSETAHQIFLKFYMKLGFKKLGKMFQALFWKKLPFCPFWPKTVQNWPFWPKMLKNGGFSHFYRNPFIRIC